MDRPGRAIVEVGERSDRALVSSRTLRCIAVPCKKDLHGDLAAARRYREAGVLVESTAEEVVLLMMKIQVMWIADSTARDSGFQQRCIAGAYAR